MQILKIIISGMIFGMFFFAANQPAHSQNQNNEEWYIKDYFKSLEGEWVGSGEIVNGKYKNTKFKCTLIGKTPEKIGMDIKGTCKIGLLRQKITAFVEKKQNYYLGTFLGGAEGEGLDIVHGQLTNNKFTATLKRENLNGAIIIDGRKKNIMEIIIAVEFEEKFYPIVELEMAKEN